MSVTLYLFFGFVAALLILLAWALHAPGRRLKIAADPSSLEETGRGHVTFLPQIRQAMAPADFAFLVSRAPGRLARRVCKERRGIALAYLSFLREDFRRQLRLARVISVLSPEVTAAQEYERLQLTLKFTWHFEMIRLQLWAGLSASQQLGGLSDLVSGLAVRIELAMKELGERAALATELASLLDRRGPGVA
jgi:hypothetical protein